MPAFPNYPPFLEDPAGYPGIPARHLNALHMSLIPVGADQGKILVWGDWKYCGDPAGETRALYWSIVDPVNKTFQDFMWCCPPGAGDIFCAGHAWTADGKLLVAGGTGWHAEPECLLQQTPPGSHKFSGSKLMYLFDPTVPFFAPNPAISNPWTQLPDLDEERWYPSVLALGTNLQQRDNLLVAGGTNPDANLLAVNSYQVFVPSLGTWEVPPPGGNPAKPNTWPGPSTKPNEPTCVLNGPCWDMGNYPRTFLLSTGTMVTAGFAAGSARLDHNNPLLGLNRWDNIDGLWLQTEIEPMVYPPARVTRWRYYGSSVLFPISLLPDGNIDLVFSTGGRGDTEALYPPTKSVLMSYAALAGSAKHWQDAPANLTHARWLHNTVLLPDSTILAVGGEDSIWQNCSDNPVYTPELFSGGQWKQLADDTIIRNYHSTALLLPSAKVLTAGGEYRRYLPEPKSPAVPNSLCGAGQTPLKTGITSASDYRVFSPPYLNCGNPRPVITSTAPAGGALQWPLSNPANPPVIQTVTFDPESVPVGVSITQVVLARAGSVTHHSDQNQRVVKLNFTYSETTPNTLLVSMPSSSGILPKGYYMLFVISSQATPSEATWVQVV